MFRTLALAGLMAAASAAPAFSATTHQVLITGNGFFPIVTYLRPGDTVVFYNEATTEINVIAEDNDTESVNWSTGDIEPGMSLSILIAEESLLAFEMMGQRWIGGEAQGEGMETTTEGSTNEPNGGGYWENFTVQGEFTFDAVVLN